MKSGKCLHEYFSYCGAKQLRRKIVIPPLSSLTLLDTRKFLKRRVPIRSTSVKWDKTFFTRSRDNPSFTSTPPLISKKLVDTSFLPKSGTVPLRIYSVLWDERNLTENRESPPVISKISRSQNFPQKPKGSFTKFFGHVRQHFFDGQSQYSSPPPSLLLINKKIVDTNFLPKPGRVLSRIFLVLWDKTVSTENRDNPSFISNISWYQKWY